MCGIAGAKGPRGRSEKTSHEVRRMTAALGQRGPDGAGFSTHGGLALGHARLAIIDLVTGDQPQTNADGTVIVSVNGEIYNYVELRAELEARGHRFRTQSDIEVIPHLYDEMGMDFVHELRGMYAIALHDTKTDELYLVRDRLGKKPIYWLRRDDRLYFASEIKAIMQLSDLDLTVDLAAVEDFFTYQYIPAPRSIFAEIRKVPAASWVRYDGRDVKTHEYWSLGYDRDGPADEEQALERVGEVLDEAVRIRLRSDVPLGAFLSGGIDSNLVMSTAAGMLDTPLRTTTISFGGANAEEVALARETARRFGTDHREKEITTDVRDVLFRVASYLDEPLGDSSTLPTWMVSKAAREDVTVAVSGDGGDETFGGYAWRYYQNVLIDRVRRRLPPPGRKLVGALASAWPKGDRMPKPLRLKWGLRNLSVSAEEAYFLDMSIFRPEDKERLYRRGFQEQLGGYTARGVLDEHFAACGSDDLLTRLMYVDLKTYLADGVLTKVDRMSMAHSLEVRSPLLDHELVELAATIPAELKLKGRRSKYLLRRLAERRCGEDVASGRKVGFAPPLAGWLRNELREVFQEDVLENPHGIHQVLDVDVLRGLFEEHVAERRDHARPLWLALTFELWYRNFGVRARLR